MPKIKLRKSKKKMRVISKGNRDEINIFKFGTLIQIETHCWIGSKRLSKAEMKELSKEEKVNWIHGNKVLVDKNKLKDIRQLINMAREKIWKVALPFPIKGVYFVPNEAREQLNIELREISSLIREEVETFADQYAEHILDAKEHLKQYFNEQDYPSDIRRKFGIYWRFFEMTIPSSITDEAYKEESERFKQLMQQTEQLGILALRESFAEIVSHLTETLTGKIDGENRRVRTNSISKISEFLNEFKVKNIFRDAELENLINKASEIVAGVTPKDLNSDRDLARLINKQIGAIKEEIDSSIEVVKRRISFDTGE